MRKILILLLLPLIAYGALYAYLWYGTKHQADTLSQAVAPFARLDYGAIFVSPHGDAVGLDNITITPLMTQELIRLDQVRVYAPDVRHFLRLGLESERGKLPEQLRLQLSGLHIDLDNPIFTMLEQLQGQMAAQSPAPVNDALLYADALGCGNRDNFSINDYREMGLGQMVADIGAEGWYNHQTNQTTLRVNTTIRQMYQLDITTEIVGRPKKGVAGLDSPSPSRISVRYHDSGYHKLRNKYCAIQSGSSIDEYIEKNIALFSAALNAYFPIESLSAYRKFMFNGGAIQLTLEPSSETPWDSLHLYRNADIIEMLGLSARIDNTRVDFDKVKWLEGKARVRAPSVSPEAKPAQTKESVVPPREIIARQPVAIARSEAKFHTIAPRDAGKHLNQMAEVTTADGRTRQGILKEADAYRLILVMKVSAGSLTYPITISDIERLRVRY